MPRSVLTTALTDSDPGVRRHAAMTLSGQGIAAAIPVLLGLVVDGDHDVEAAESLARLIGSADLVDDVMDAVDAALAAPSTPAPARARLAQALVEIATPRARARLLSSQATRIPRWPCSPWP